MSFNIEVQGGKNYLLPTAGKYCPQDIEIAAIGGATEGMYCWAKFAEEPELPIGYTPLESLALTGSNYFILDYIVTTANFAKLKVVADIAITGTSSNNYRLDGCAAQSGHFYFGITSSGQYGYSVNSDSTTGVTADTSRHTHTLDVPNKKYTVDSVVNITTNPNTSQTINKPFVVGGYLDTGYTNEYITHGKTIWKYEFYENNVLVRNYIPVLDADGIACLYDTVTGIKVYASGTGDVVSGSAGDKVVADGYVLSDNLNAYPQDGYGEDGFYYKRLEDNIPWHEAGSYVWSKSDADGNLIEYVVSDNPSEFPEDGQGDDGYYYKSVTSMIENPVEFRYASGSGSTPSSSYDGASFVVSGVAFRPKTIFLTWNATGQVNNTIVADFNGTVKQTDDYNGSDIAITDDGFTFFTNSGLYPSNTLSYSWMATGV